MMKEITYDQALELSKKYKDKDKITLILFKDEHCPFCNEFIPDVLEKILPDFQQHIDFYIVPNFEGNPFPPPTTPVTYIYVPGKSKNKMPLIKSKFYWFEFKVTNIQVHPPISNLKICTIV